MRRSLSMILVALAGCIASEAPLPPHDALARAHERINTLLKDEAFYRSRQSAAPASDPAPKNSSVLFWSYQHPLMASVVARGEAPPAFKIAYPDVDTQFIGEWRVAIQKLTVNLAAGEMPDVCVVKRGWLAQLIESGRLLPLDGLLPREFIDDLEPASKSAFSKNGTLWALPSDGYCSVLYCNRALVGNTPPKTWDELERACETIRKTHGDTICPIGDMPYLETLYSASGEVCDENQSRLDSDQALEALLFILKLRDKQFLDAETLGAPGRARELFFSGKVAMTVASSEYLREIESARIPAYIAPIPGKQGPIALCGENAIVVFAQNAQSKRDAIADVLSFLTGDFVQGAEAAAAGSHPVRRSVTSNVNVAPHLREAFSVSRSTPLISSWSAAEYELYRWLSLAYAWHPEVK